MNYTPWTICKSWLAERLFLSTLFVGFTILSINAFGYNPVISSDTDSLLFTKKERPLPVFKSNSSFSACGPYNSSWLRNYGGTNTEVARSILQTSDGGFLIGGHTLSDDIDVSANNGGVDFWLLRTDATGNILWDKNYGGSSTETGKCVQETPDGGFIFIGDAFSNNGDVGGTAGSFDFWVVKLDADGNIVWKELYGGSNADNPEWIEPTPDGGYIIAGVTSSSDGDVTNNQGIFDCWLLKIDATGTVQFSTTFGGSLEDAASFVQNTNDGGFIVVGNTYSSNGDIPGSNGDLDATCFKLDALGNLQWSRNFGGTRMDFAECVRQTLDGGYIITGVTESFDLDFVGNHGSRDAFVIKLDADGNTLWTQLYGGGAEDGGSVILSHPDGTYTMAGYSFSIGQQVAENNGLGDIWIVKLDADGNIISEDTYGGTMTENVQDMRFTNTNGVVMCGFTESSDVDMPGNNGQGDFWAAVFEEPPVAPPVASLGPDILNVCIGESVTLDATDETCPSCTYSWGGSLTNPLLTLSPTLTASYTVTVTNSEGCTAEDEIIIGVSNLGIAVTNVLNPSGCSGKGLIETTAFGGSGNYTYTWDYNNSNNPSQFDLCAGLYTLTISDGLCEIVEVFDLVNVGNDTPPSVDLGTDQSFCTGETINLSPTVSDCNNCTFEWNNNPNQNTQNLTVSTAGTYTLVISNDEGCTATDVVEVTTFSNPTLELGQDISLCNNSYNISSGISGVNYAWSTGDNTANISVTESDTYQLTITDNNNCTASDAIQVDLFSAPNLELGQNQVSCLPVDLNPNLSNVSYNWSTGESNPSIEAANTNWYVLTVTDNATACSVTDSVFVEIVENLEIDLGADPSACGSVTLDAGAPNLQYTWSTTESSQSIEVTSSDWYSVTVQDGDGCSDVDSVFVTVFPEATLDLGQDITTCATTTLDATLTGANYAWSTGEDTPSIEAATSDTYSLTLTDSNGCTATDEVQVTLQSSLEIDLGQNIQSCVPVTLNAGVSNATYEWFDLGTGQMIPNNAQTLQVDNSSMYALTVTNSEGCSAIDTIDVSITSDLSLDLGADIMSCGEIVIETGNPNAEHEWSPSADTTNSIMVSTTGTVAVTITDDNGCTASDSLFVTISEDLALDYESQNLSCANSNDGTIELIPSGGMGAYSYNWEDGETTNNLAGLSEGIYLVTLTDEGGCTSTESITIEAPQAINASLSADMLSCTNAQTTIETTANGGTGNYTYAWNTNADTPTIEVQEAATYTLVVTDENDCSTTESIEITTSNPLEIEVESVVNNQCANDATGSISLNVVEGNGNYTYNWTNQNTGNTFSNQESSINNLEGATYQIVVTDDQGCSETIEATVESPSPFSHQIQAQNGCGDNGEAEIQVLGGTAPYSYSWSNGAASAEISDLPSGTYTVQVSDANACSFEDVVEINNNEYVDFELSSNPISCYGETDASASVTPLNGVAPFSYQWSDGTTSNSIDNLGEGIYTVLVIDANDCSSAESLTINAPNALQLNHQISTQGIVLQPLGGTPSYNILWSNGHTGLVLENPTETVYTITLTDANGCQLVETINTTTSTTLLDFVENFDVFPNPNDGYFQVNIQLLESSKSNLIVRNALGQIVSQETFDGMMVQTTFDLTNQSKGIYFVEMQTAEFSVFKKIVLH